MSAMRALALPDSDAVSQAAVTWAVPVQIARTEAACTKTAPTETAPTEAPPGGTAPAEAGRAQVTRVQVRRVRPAHVSGPAHTSGPVPARAVRSQAVRNQAVRGQAVRNSAERGHAAPVPLRLTMRGRIVVAVAAALLVSLLSLLATGAAQATGRAEPPRVADRNLTQVVVRPGQSLWSVAESADPDADPQSVVQQIIELNGLSSDVIQAGQQLWVPRG